MMQSWNPLTPIFQGATLSNYVFNININTTLSPQNYNPYKRRRVIIDDDSQ